MTGQDVYDKKIAKDEEKLRKEEEKKRRTEEREAKKSGKRPVKQSSNCDKPKRKTRAVVIDKNLCYLCMEYDPDNSEDEDVDWQGCAGCPRWYHTMCISNENAEICPHCKKHICVDDSTE